MYIYNKLGKKLNVVDHGATARSRALFIET